LAGVRVSLMNDTADGGDAAGDELNSIENLTGSGGVNGVRSWAAAATIPITSTMRPTW
jgi:hypothetical protein